MKNHTSDVREDDLLGVLTTARPVVDAAVHVQVDAAGVEMVADQIAGGERAAPSWDDTLHFRDGTWRTAAWVLLLDALNFCFWSDDPDPTRRWRVAFRDQVYDGYWALAAALTRAVEEGCPLWDASYLAVISEAELAQILRGYPDVASAPQIPLFAERVANARELGQGLLAHYGGEAPAADLIASAEQSAVRLVQRVVEIFPSFNDVAWYREREVRFYKRAQILVADLFGSFAGEGLGAFADLGALTAFADYKVPQVLRGLGVLVYDETLATMVDRYQPLPAGSPAEVEIRAATIWACEWIRRALARRDRHLHAFEIDWALWSAGQHLPSSSHPYHRTRTTSY